MQKIIAPLNAISAQSSSSDTIFYDIVGNFVPPEWRVLTSHNGKVLSKTTRQILSLIVSRIKSDRFFAQESSDTAKNAKLNELQESYYYFDRS